VVRVAWGPANRLRPAPSAPEWAPVPYPAGDERQCITPHRGRSADAHGDLGESGETP
jgi:hypothetical protein